MEVKGRGAMPRNAVHTKAAASYFFPITISIFFGFYLLAQHDIYKCQRCRDKHSGVERAFNDYKIVFKVGI